MLFCAFWRQITSKTKQKHVFFAYFAGFFSCQKGHFDGRCAIKESLEGGYKHCVGVVGGVRQGATQGAMGYTPGGMGLVGEDEKERGMVRQRKKLDGLGIFGGSGEGMYYGVFGLVARCERSKPPPPW